MQPTVLHHNSYALCGYAMHWNVENLILYENSKARWLMKRMEIIVWTYFRPQYKLYTQTKNKNN